MKLSTVRRITLSLVVLAVIVGLIWHTGTGTLSSFGWRDIAAICPLGAVESFLASRNILPIPLIVLLVIFGLSILLGKVFCSWLCPVPPLRRIFYKKKKPTAEHRNALKAAADKTGDEANGPSVAASVPDPRAGESAAAGEVAAGGSAAGGVAAATATIGMPAASGALLATAQPAPGEKSSVQPLTVKEQEVLGTSGCKSGCNTCATQRKKLDSRHVILGGALLSTAIFGFPVFCLVCPVGLVFATIIAFWHWIGFNQLSLTLIVFPAILALEVLVLRKWCVKFCPLGAAFSLLSLPNRFFRPRVDESKCLRLKGIDCNLCVDYCDEGLDPHFSKGMHECSKCGHCMEHCPAHAISMPFKPAKKEKETREPLKS